MLTLIKNSKRISQITDGFIKEEEDTRNKGNPLKENQN